MLELLKLLVDAFVLRDSARKGMLTWKVMLTGFGFALFLYATALPATLLYEKHPQYEWVFITAITIDALAVILFMIFGTRWYLRAKARYEAQSVAQSTARSSGGL
jgi:membrane protein YdbS with pleckstrin-like domain